MSRPQIRRFGRAPWKGGFASSQLILFGAMVVGGAWVAAHAAGGRAAPGDGEGALAGLAQLERPAVPTGFGDPEVREVINRYCVICHNQAMLTANLALDDVDPARAAEDAEVWEKVITKLRAGTMPPTGMPRPDEATYEAVASYLESEIDRAWAANPNPGRINAIHRLNRMEYNNAVNDLLGLDVDARELLPGDETADGGFDNMAGTLTISTAHMERYMSVARQLTRMAVGLPPANADYHVFRVNELLQQTDLMSEDLPLGSRGGMAVPFQFPVDGEYVIRVRLTTNYAEYIRGMGWPQLIDVRIDGQLVERFTAGGGAREFRPAASTYEGAGQPGFQGDWEWEAYMQSGAHEHLEVRTFVTGGPHTVGISFPMYMFESEVRHFPQPPVREWGRTGKYNTYYMGYAGVNEVHISGPYQVAGMARDTPSRRQIFICEPESPAQEEACAERILERMARLAYRRPVEAEDVATLMEFFRQGREDGRSFDAGVQFALERILVDPDFLLRVYRDPPQRLMGVREDQDGDGGSSTTSYPLSDLEIASRLSFFLWSSVPDEVLLELAEQGRLREPGVLRSQVQRMLADRRAASALTIGFANQWLNVRVLEDKVADEVLYPMFDDNLLEAFQLETEMFVESTIREDRSILDLLRADYTYVNERLARHYGIPGVYGSRMRRVELPDLEQRGGLLGHGGLLALTAYPNRTSPVIRGKWLLDNILGSPVPNPPEGVDTSLEESGAVEAATTIRERLAFHRSNPVCATCHATMDPLGFALESFDATGAWRETDERGLPVDNVGLWPSGREIQGFTGLRDMLLEKREMFARNLTEKLMTYALGRRVEYFDRPAIRKVVRDAEADDYSWSSIITGIVESPGFLMRAQLTQ